MNVKIYKLERGDVFTMQGIDVPLRFHGMDGMYARVTHLEFEDLNDAFAAKAVGYISCSAEVEKLETSGTTSGGSP